MIGDRLQMKLNVIRKVTIQPPHKRPFFQQPSGIRREAMGETAGIRKLPPPAVPAKFFRVLSLSKPTTMHSKPGFQG